MAWLQRGIIWTIALALIPIGLGCGGKDDKPARRSNQGKDPVKKKENPKAITKADNKDNAKKAATAPTKKADAGQPSAKQPIAETKKAAVSPAVTSKAAANAAPDAGPWGSLTASFVLDGPVPARSPARITKDVEFCGKHSVIDESLLVNSKNGGVENVVVYLYLKRGAKAPKVHPSYSKVSPKVILDNDKCRFAPHIAVLTTTQTLVLGNKDPVAHNTKIQTSSNPPSNENLPSKATIEQKFAAAERLPAPVSCSIHPWMLGYVLVRDDPYFAISNTDGQFVIKNLPEGEWTFQAWHERGRITQAAVGGKDTKWSKGRFTVKITAGGVTDLGVVKLSPDVFK